MISRRGELQKKIEGIITELDFSELIKEPTFNNLDNFLKLLKENKIETCDDENPEGFKHKIFVKVSEGMLKSLCNYNNEVIRRTEDWRRNADKLLSNLVKEEVGISEKDMVFIKRPLCLYKKFIYDTSIISQFLKDFGFDIKIKYRNNDIPVQKLMREYKNHGGETISTLYFDSLENLVDIFAIQTSSVDFLKFDDDIFKNIILESTKNIEIKLHEEELKKVRAEMDEKARKYAEIKIDECREEIMTNIEMMDSIYGTFKKEGLGMCDLFEKQMDHSFKKKNIILGILDYIAGKR
jgi:hypothetical protein